MKGYHEDEVLGGVLEVLGGVLGAVSHRGRNRVRAERPFQRNVENEPGEVDEP